MSKHKIIGSILIVAAALINTGFVFNSPAYWFFIDAVVVLICGICGLVLVLEKNNN